ncbi:DNA topoisomerase 2-binding protein 1-B [Phytophthora ramorum]|uniref:DNA topoisomerase 2-binding protein 1-B n=1 Tax=Phytophthora ramorum TaxID=164328 RepID=UPI00309B5965|nr:DNA topoisomerase 2-binding protein 1-B [Phytophthora ramorum]
MRQRDLYATLQCVVHPAELDVAELLALELCLRDGGASLLEDADAATGCTVTHIVCHPKAYETFVEQRNERFVALVRPEWVFRTFLLQRLLPVDRFSPNPALLFSTLAISAGSMAKDPRKVINGLVTHFGGQIVDQKEVYAGATHILYQEDAQSEPFMGQEGQEQQKQLQLSFSKADLAKKVEAWRLYLTTEPNNSTYTLPSCVVAFMGQRAGLATQHHVKYTWVEECVRRQCPVPEGPFAHKPAGAATTKPSKTRNWKTQPEMHLEDLNLSKCAQVYQLGRTELSTELSVVRKLSNDKLEAMKKTLHGAIVLLAQHIAPLLREKLCDMLKTVDAKVANVPFGEAYKDIVGKVVTNASFIVCRYRGGFEYDEAMRQDKNVVSIYWVLAGLSQVNNPTPFNEAIQRPVKSFGSIAGMQSLVITLSGYSSKSSPTREELQIAIHATGACLLPVLSRTHSTHLLCYEASGEKYKKALSWRFDNVLSHEWIFACLSKWEYVPEDVFRYNSIKELSGDTDSTASDHSSKKRDSQEIKLDDEIVSKTKLAITPSARSAKKVKKAGQGRFDVDGILTEIDKVPTPTDKKVPANRKEATPAVASMSTSTSPGRVKDVACTLFDTPTNPSAPSTKRKTRKRGTDESMPLDEVSADVEEVEEEPAAKATKNDAESAKDPPLVISISTDSNSDESGTVEPASASSANQDSANATKTSAKKSTAKKRKAAESKKAPPAKASTKKQKKETVADKKSRAASPKTKRVFLLTGDRDQAIVHTSIISSLGGTVSDFGRVFDNNCTHIICSELKRTEKFIAGCAAGKWILKPSYLEACATAEKFVDEAAHEWGTHASDKKNIDQRIWPGASGYWRKERTGGHPGAFAGWRFFIHAKCVPPRDMCERIALAGGGSVIPLTKAADFNSLAKESTLEAPVVALFSPEVPTRDLWLKKLKEHEIQCLKATFLIDYITKKQAPPVKRADYHL